DAGTRRVKAAGDHRVVAEKQGRKVFSSGIWSSAANVAPGRDGGRRQSRALAGLCPLAELGEPLRRQAAPGGMDRAGRWIALTDGGAGLEEFMRVYFPRAECVLDFYHAAEHLNDLAKAVAGGDEARAAELAQGWCHTLKYQGGGAVLAQLEGLDPRGR